MTNTAAKIVKWAESQQNNYGAHVYAVVDAIKAGNLGAETVADLESKLEEWRQAA